MAERLVSRDLLAYHVNYIGELDQQVVKAFVTKDADAKRQLVQVNNNKDMHLYICVNDSWHAFVLCVPWGPFDEGDRLYHPQLFENADCESPNEIDPRLFCWTFELVFADEEQRMYRLRKNFCQFRDVERRIKRSYHIGHYKSVNPYCLQFSALEASPHRYAAIISDCVEFSKELCLRMLSYCSNWRQVEATVNENITKATASGLSVEHLSRRYRTSGLLGNLSLGGVDVSTFLSQRNKLVLGLVIFLFVSLWQVLLTVLVVKYLA